MKTGASNDHQQLNRSCTAVFGASSAAWPPAGVSPLPPGGCARSPRPSEAGSPRCDGHPGPPAALSAVFQGRAGGRAQPAAQAAGCRPPGAHFPSARTAREADLRKWQLNMLPVAVSYRVTPQTKRGASRQRGRPPTPVPHPGRWLSADSLSETPSGVTSHHPQEGTAQRDQTALPGRLGTAAPFTFGVTAGPAQTSSNRSLRPPESSLVVTLS